MYIVIHTYIHTCMYTYAIDATATFAQIVMFDLPANLRTRYVCILNNVPCRFVACAMSGSSVCVMCSFLSHALLSAARRSLVLDFSASAKAMWAVMPSRGLELAHNTN